MTYNFWVHVGILFVAPALFLQLCVFAATRSFPAHIFARRKVHPIRIPRPDAQARKLLEAAAAAAITCNMNGRATGVSEAPLRFKGTMLSPKKTVLRTILARASFVAWVFRSPLGSPLRERIHLETLVFLSVENCATAPDVVSDVILQVLDSVIEFP